MSAYRVLWTGLICAALTATGLAASEAAAFNAEQLAAFRSVAYTQIVSARVARIDPAALHGLAILFRPTFHRHRRVTEWRPLDGASATALGRVLQQQIASRVVAYATGGDDYVAELSSFCIPRPVYAVRLETDKGRRDFLICVDCGDVEVFDGLNRPVSFTADQTTTVKLRSFYQAEFGPRPPS